MLDNADQRSLAAAHPCGKCAFYADSLWHPVAKCDLGSLARGFSRRALQEGQLLFKQGEENRGIYCVSVGLIALRTHHLDGSSTLMRLAYPGEVVGIRSFLSKQPHQTEARALLPSRICTVGHRTADRVTTQSVDTMRRLASRCLYEMDRNHARIIAAAKRSNKQRLADLLQRLMTVHGTAQAGHRSMRLPLSRMDLADLIGVQPETMSRLIKRLEQDGQFSFAGREVRQRVEGAPF